MRLIAEWWLDAARNCILPVMFKGHTVEIIETLRDGKRQAEVLASGSSQLKVGWHNYGLAFDFAVYNEHGIYISNGEHQAYESLGRLGQAFGCIWGIRVNGRLDAGHLEYHPGITLAQYQAFLDAGKSSTEIIRT